MNNMGATKVMATKRPRAVRGRAFAMGSLKDVSDRDRALITIGDDTRGASSHQFEVGSKSKAANDEYDQLVGRRLARARDVVGLAADDAAEALKISKQTLYKYEKGERALKAKTLYDAVKIYGVDAGWLLCLTDDLKVTRTDDEGRTLTVTYSGMRP